MGSTMDKESNMGMGSTMDKESNMGMVATMGMGSTMGMYIACERQGVHHWQEVHVGYECHNFHLCMYAICTQRLLKKKKKISHL